MLNQDAKIRCWHGVAGNKEERIHQLSSIRNGIGDVLFILLIHGVVFSASKKYDYPPLVTNVGWLGLLSVVRLGGQRALECRGANIVHLLSIHAWFEKGTRIKIFE